MTYYEADGLYEIQKVTGKKIYVHFNGTGTDGYLDELEEKKMWNYLFCEIFEGDEENELYVEVTYWDKLFDYNDDGYYNVLCYEVYGDWSVDHYEYERETDGDEVDEDVTWNEKTIAEVMA